MSNSWGSTEESKALVEAVKRAQEKGIIFVAASGNSSSDNDKKKVFPSNIDLDNVISVGAHDQKGKFASFSNYGKKSVDIFAPGVAIKSTSTDDEYDTADGTSVASPVTAGIAALIMSYYPEFTASQVKDILLKSSVKFENLMVEKPNSYEEETEMVEFSELSRTGGVINALEAVKMAESMMVSKNK